MKKSLFLNLALTLSFAAASVACGGAPPTEDLAVSEGAAYMTAAESEDELGGDAVAGMDESSVDSQADELANDEMSAALADGYTPCDFDANKQKIIDTYDADGDGQLDNAEAQALRAEIEGAVARRPRLQQLVQHVRHSAFYRVKWAFDEDGDGTLDDAEKQAMVAAMEARCSAVHDEALSRWDADGDGALSADELIAARAALRARLVAKRDAVMAEYDANGDGILDVTERAAMRADVASELRSRADAVKSRYDTNGDGILDESELAALRADVQAQIES